MAKRTVVKVDFEKLIHLIEKTEWSQAAFARLVGKHSRWLSDVSKGHNLPSPEEAARMCVLLQTIPEEILLHKGATEKETEKCQADIALVKSLVEQENSKKAPDPQIEGDARKIIDFVRFASEEEMAEIENFVAYLESKRKK